MYYRLQGNSAIMTAYIEAINETQDSLVLGRSLDEQNEELPYIYSYHDPVGNSLPDFFGGDCIMSKKMYNVFKECGVDNIQSLPLQFIDKKTEEVRDDYIVFNIIGLVSCGNLDESDTLPLGGGFYFQNLVIDPAKTHNLFVFRLAESLMDIIVSEDVAKKLEKNNIQGVTLTPACKYKPQG